MSIVHGFQKTESSIAFGTKKRDGLLNDAAISRLPAAFDGRSRHPMAPQRNMFRSSTRSRKRRLDRVARVSRDHPLLGPQTARRQEQINVRGHHVEYRFQQSVTRIPSGGFLNFWARQCRGLEARNPEMWVIVRDLEEPEFIRFSDPLK